MGKKLILTITLCLAFVISANAEIDGLDIGAEVVFGIKIVKPVIGIDINKIYAGFHFESLGTRLFANLSLGGGINFTSRDLGTTLLFRASVGIGYRLDRHRISIIFDHVSNGDLVSYNPGLNVYGIRYGYQF